jgi:thymidine phosphorylase
MPHRSDDEILLKLRQHLQDGSAWRKFLQVAEAQGGDLSLLTEPKRLYRAPIRREVKVSGGSLVSTIDTRQLGLAILALGGGRRLVTDKINPWVGLTGLKRIGATVAKNEPVAIIHAADEASADLVASMVANAYSLGDSFTSNHLFEDIK